MVMMNLRRRVMGSKKNLPYDAEVEYLECSGTQWVDTDIDTDPFDISFSTQIYYPDGGERAIIGNNGSGVFEFYVSGKTIALYNNSSPRWLTFNNMPYNAIHVVEGTMSTVLIQLKVDGQLKQNVTTIPSTNRRLRLFQHNNSYKYIGRMYYMKINIAGELVRDYIPVRVGQVGYLYDKVSGELFANAGTGDFILGPDKN